MKKQAKPPRPTRPARELQPTRGELLDMGRTLAMLEHDDRLTAYAVGRERQPAGAYVCTLRVATGERLRAEGPELVEAILNARSLLDQWTARRAQEAPAPAGFSMQPEE